MVWGGVVDLASADDKMIKVRHPLRLDPQGLLLASIMAKKKAVNASHVLIDIPVGRYAKMDNRKEALELKRRFKEIGRKLGMKVKVVITDGKQPIGKGIGPNLEAKDVLNVLMGKGPKDLRDKSIKMAVYILKMLKIKSPKNKVLEALDSGSAYDKMKEIIRAQEGKIFKPEQLKLGNFKKNVYSSKKGRVKELNNKDVSKIARMAGAPLDKAAGIYLCKKLKDRVDKKELLFVIYAGSKKRLNYAFDLVKEKNPYIIS
jgi:thymidine phosphorylase